MRIDSVHLHHIGPFEHLTLELPPGSDPDRADVYLLVGPNGSGKSTILYSLAGVLSLGHDVFGENLGAKRFRNPESCAVVHAGDSIQASTPFKIGFPRGHLSVPNTGLELTLKHQGGRSYFYGNSHSRSALESFATAAAMLQVATSSAVLSPRFSWAAFAYAGMRSVEDVHVKAITQPSASPFEQSLSFIHTADTEELANWISNQEFRKLKANANGRHERASEIERSIRQIESAISEIIGEDFRFALNEDDNNVRASRSGRIVDLGLLPDGLKSIVSWVADLLMRLDRIPWENDLPPTDREFLLLLDEVDVHLHPLWQRKVLPIIQRIFPRAQIIASTHSPFVVASAEDAHIVTLQIKDGVSTIERTEPSQSGVSYSAVLRSIFGVDSEFDVQTERLFEEFHQAKEEWLAGNQSARSKAEAIAHQLAMRSEEVRELIALEMRQVERRLTEAPRK